MKEKKELMIKKEKEKEKKMKMFSNVIVCFVKHQKKEK